MKSRTHIVGGLLVGLATIAAAAAPAAAQSLMVGVDGAIHLDQGVAVDVNDPVIIEQTPQLIQPSIVPGGQPGGFAIQPSMLGGAAPYGAYSAPFVPCAPMASALAPQAMPIKFAVFGEFLFLHPTGVDMVHAQQQDGVGPGALPLGELGVTDFHYEPGVRVGGDMAVGPSTSVAATYTYFESNAHSRLTPPDVPGGAVGSLVHIPDAGILGSTGPVDARSVLDFQLADGEYRARLLQGPSHWINGGVGLRYAHLEQKFSQTGVFAGASPGSILTQSNIDFDGGGPKLALDGGRSIGNSGFSAYGRAGVSPLAGEFRSVYNLRNDTTGDALAHVNWNDDRIMTLLDYELGLAWTSPRRRWRFSAGYTQSFWFNAVTTAEFIDAVQASQYTDVSDTIMFDGLTARVEHLW